MDIGILLQNIINALQWGSFYALIALGYTLVYGVLLLINFAHGDIFMVGAYIAFFVVSFMLSSSDTAIGLGLSPGMALGLAIPLTMILTACVGVTLERVAYRPLRNKGAHRLYVVITALMCGLILEYGNLAMLGASRKKFPDLIENTVYHFSFDWFENTAHIFGSFLVTDLKIVVIGTAIGVFLFLNFIVTKTKIGMAMRGISYDKFAIPLMGIPVNTIIVFTFILGSGFAGLAGFLFAMSYPVLEPFMGALIGWKAFIAAVVGGIGDIRGAFFGGFLLGFIEVMVVAFFPSTLKDFIAFAILLAILWVKPTGLFGKARHQKI